MKLKLTNIGDQFLTTWGERNLARKEAGKSWFYLPTTFIQLVNTADDVTSGGYQTFKIG